MEDNAGCKALSCTAPSALLKLSPVDREEGEGKGGGGGGQREEGGALAKVKKRWLPEEGHSVDSRFTVAAL